MNRQQCAYTEGGEWRCGNLVRKPQLLCYAHGGPTLAKKSRERELVALWEAEKCADVEDYRGAYLLLREHMIGILPPNAIASVNAAVEGDEGA